MTVALDRRQVIELNEYQRLRAPALQPAAADLDLAERLLGDETGARLAVRWLVNGEIDVSSGSWVGVVRFTECDIHVVPKLVGGALRVLRMLEYAAGVHMLRRLPRDRPLPANGNDLFDLICLLLAQETEVLVRDGLLRDYRAVDDSLPVLRGRLRVRDQYLRRFGILDRVECHYDEYDGNTPDNQLLAAALLVSRRVARDAGIRSALSRLGGVLEEICEPPTVDADWFDKAIRYGRRNARYRPAHELAKLVLRGLAFDDLYDTSSGRTAAFLVDMNDVFERFATRLVQEALVGTKLRVIAQPRLRAVIRNDATNRSYATIRPDLVIEELATGRTVPVDVKYKKYDERKIASGDVYQTFLYAYALAEDPRLRRAGILYPSTGGAGGARLSIAPLSGATAARIVAAGIDVPESLDALDGAGRPELLDEVRRIVGRLTALS